VDDGLQPLACRGVGENQWRMRARSSAPSAMMASGPKAARKASIAAPPAAVLAREIASASTTAAPRAASRAATVLLPLPMPPVRPRRSGVGGVAWVGVDEGSGMGRYFSMSPRSLRFSPRAA
jgi:hypothetical protein